MAKLTKDSNGDEIRDGDLISFAYGMPPKGVQARVVERGGHLIALTPHETPTECRLDKLAGMVGGFYKTMPRAEEVGEVESRLFRSRQALSGNEKE